MIDLMLEIVHFFPPQKTRKAPLHFEGMLMLFLLRATVAAS